MLNILQVIQIYNVFMKDKQCQDLNLPPLLILRLLLASMVGTAEN